MPANEIHVGDVGTTFSFSIKAGSTSVDLSGGTFTSQVLYFQKPNEGSVTTVSCTAFNGAGTNGVIIWTSTTGFFDTSGAWQVQAKISLGANLWYTEILEFEVHRNLG